MARPSVKEQRTEEILDAFERCVGQFGVEGTSLERIAEESGLRRSLLRHHIGNRDELVDALATRLVQKYSALLDGLFEDAQGSLSSRDLVELLFDPRYRDQEGLDRVFEALLMSANSYPAVNECLKAWYNQFIDMLTVIVKADKKSATNKRCRTAVIGVVSIYFNLESLSPLQLGSGYRLASKQAALVLIDALD